MAIVKIYSKIFVDWIDKEKLTKSFEIKENIKIIKVKEANTFLDMIIYYIFKLVYKMNDQEINTLFEDKNFPIFI